MALTFSREMQSGVQDGVARLIFVCAAVGVLTSGCVTAALGEQIPLENEHGVYMVPVRINQAVSIPFVLDSGAAEVSIPTDVFMTLMRSHSVKDTDFIGEGTFTTADGSKHKNQQFILREVQVGTHVVRDVVANVVPIEGDPLLGQSFLSRLPSWSKLRPPRLPYRDLPGPAHRDGFAVAKPSEPAVYDRADRVTTSSLQAHPPGST
jgi:hypothetical protein